MWIKVHTAWHCPPHQPVHVVSFLRCDTPLHSIRLPNFSLHGQHILFGTFSIYLIVAPDTSSHFDLAIAAFRLSTLLVRTTLVSIRFCLLRFLATIRLRDVVFLWPCFPFFVRLPRSVSALPLLPSMFPYIVSGVDTLVCLLQNGPQ